MSDADKIISLYERHAEAWIRQRESGFFAEAQWMEKFQSLLPPASTILDLGCGSGRPIAEHFIHEGFRILGVDSSTTLIDRCRKRYPDQHWIEADIRELSLDRRFQGLIAWDSLFHLSHEDQRSMFAIFGDHAAEGAPLIFTSGTEHGVAVGEFEGERLYHASLASNEYREILESSGFRIISHQAEDPHCGKHAIWLCQATQLRKRSDC